MEMGKHRTTWKTEQAQHRPVENAQLALMLEGRIPADHHRRRDTDPANVPVPANAN